MVPDTFEGASGRPVVGRYDPREIAARIDKRRRQRGLSVRAMCETVGLQRWDWSRKVRLDGSSFTLDEIGRIADVLEAPPGWPFLPEEIGEMVRHLVAH